MAEHSTTIVVAATPTPNGDLHLGHMAGPYLAGDVYTRYLRAAGRPVIHTTCTDDSQSYVVSTAHRQGTTPAQLCASSTEAISSSLAAMGITIAGLPPVDDHYRRSVLAFVTGLHAAGKLRTRSVRLPVATNAGTYLYDGLIAGTCPVCLAVSSGGACEACGHPNNFDELIDPYSTMDPTDPVGYRERTILVLPMEDYRDRLTAYYASKQGHWRPHALRLIRELLAKPLPDVPVTFPAEWGLPVPFPETPGQVIYPWIEGVPAVMYATWWAATKAGNRTESFDAHWRTEQDAKLVYFHGFDNVYHWGLMDLVLLMAYDERYVLPIDNVCNEFYDLGDEKFSTSRNHLILGRELLAEVPRDLARFHLALTAPELQRTSFTREALSATVPARLVEPWNGLADALALAVAGVDPAKPQRTSPAGRHRAAAMRERFIGCYELPDYSMSRAAETLATQLARLHAQVGTGPAPVRLGDLLLEVRTLLAGAAPILIDVAAAATGVDLRPAAGLPDAITAFELPRLPGLPRLRGADHAGAVRQFAEVVENRP
ncbi:MAG TPA: class I tRNA ligase family protein [Pseudonocardiaceae bacterium]|jgi:methionyl-tRNA synthetase|nr:class I tRNA ligase family protein [Pseudonocardiaceae bacterium]